MVANPEKKDRTEERERPKNRHMEKPLPNNYCVFCEIIAHREPAEILYEDEDVLIIRNVLRWVPVMLLSIPKTHMTQKELWTNGIAGKIASIGAEIGSRYCPEGFRFVANFGHHAMQSQHHGHLHILGGTFLGTYA